MNHKMAFTALSLAIVLGGASGAMAAEKKHNEAHQAFAAGNGGGQVSDPRHAPQGRSHPTWCDVDEHCNGWGEWLQDVNGGKLKN